MAASIPSPLRGRSAIVGAATHGIGEAPGQRPLDLAAQAARKALADAGLTLADVDALFVCTPDDALSGVRSLGLGPVTVVGHSNGGLRTLRACGEAPELFERVIAIDSYAVFKHGKHPGEPANLRGDRVYPDLAATLGRYRLLPEQPHVEPWALAHVARHSVRPVPGGWTWKFDALMPSGLGQEDDGDELLAAVRCPVHYVYGSDSAIVSDALAQRIVRQLCRGHGPIAIPGGHHHLMFDQPVALISTLRALLA